MDALFPSLVKAFVLFRDMPVDGRVSGVDGTLAFGIEQKVAESVVEYGGSWAIHCGAADAVWDCAPGCLVRVSN